MERYNEYKDSCVQWLGEIPSHWEVRRLNTFGLFAKGGGISRDNLQDDGKPAILYGDIYTKYNIYADNIINHISESIAEKSIRVFPGDILMTGSGETKEDIGKTIVFRGKEAYIGGDVILFRQVKNNSAFLSYALNSQFAKDYRYRESKGEIIVHIYANNLKRLYLPIPPLSEQQAIAAYLDTVTSKIDAAIAQQQKMIDLLNERKQIIINNAVTKGLNPNVKMKDSGVDWIGEICNNWRIYRLKHLLKTNLMYGANESAESEENSFPRYIRITDIDENGKLKPDTFRSLEPQKAEPYLLTKGDILFARSGATAGKTYLFDEDIKACFAGYLIKAQVSNGLLPQYLMYFTRSGIYDQWRNSIFIQATIQNIGADKYANLRIPLPSIEEQKAIVNYLNKESEKIDNVLYAHKKQISLLQERKQIIINEVVTGKVKVK